MVKSVKLKRKQEAPVAKAEPQQAEGKKHRVFYLLALEWLCFLCY